MANPTVSTAASKQATTPPEMGLATVSSLEQLVKKYAIVKLKELGPIEQAMTQVAGLKAMREALDPLMPHFMELAGTENGFLTDRDKTDKYPPYTAREVREALITALQRGLMPTGNEFNIISGRCYTTKEGYRALVRNFDGLTGLREIYGVPRMSTGGAIVPCEARWRLNGGDDSLKAEIAVRLNQGQGADAAIGKAVRKLLARVYARLTGSEFTADDAQDDVPLQALTERQPQGDKVAGLLEQARGALKRGTELAPGEIPEPIPGADGQEG